MILYSDLETYSEVPISHGAWAYAEGAEVLLWAWAVDDAPAQCWDVHGGEPIPCELESAIRDADIHVGFNWGGFDDVILTVSGFPYHPPLAKVHDVMVQALAHSLPAKLETLGEVLGVPQELAKIKDGRRLINLFCKPRPKNMKLRRAGPETHPEDWEKFKEYARNDVEDMRWCYKTAPRWNYPDNTAEYALWQLDQKINRRGIRIDLDLVHAALAATERVQEDLAGKAHLLTDGAVNATTQRDALLAHLEEAYEVKLPDMTAATVESYLDKADIPETMREVLLNRLESTRTSTAKYRKIAGAVSADGRLRGLLQFLGALRTGRWAGRTVQPQNFVRPPKRVKKLWEAMVREVLIGSIDLVDERPLEVVSGVLRGVFVGDPEIAVADLSNIEGRIVAWLGREEWKLQAFREYDTGVGPDLYKLSYARSFNISPAEVDDEKRQIGKVQELALGFGGGAGAFVTFALAYNIDLDALADKALPNIPEDVQQDAAGMLNWLYKKRAGEKEVTDALKLKVRGGLSERTWIACDCLKRLWRRAHPGIEAFWGSIQAAFLAAVRNPGTIYRVNGRVAVRCDSSWVRIRLPSGRFLCYPGAIADEHDQLSYMGINQYSRKWQRIRTYGGKLCENVTQAIARDVLAEGMRSAENAHYEVLLSVHDELITHSQTGGHQGLIEAMSAVPPWAEGLPLSAAGFTSARYRKD